MDILSFLDRSDFLKDASTKSRQLLADICVPKKIEKKETLFCEGERGTAFFLLGSGAIGLNKGMTDGREVVIRVIKPGELFAEVVLFEMDCFPVTAVAMKPSLVFSIPKTKFSRLLDDPDFRKDFIVMLMAKQRYLADRIRFLTMHDVEDRFFLFIKQHFGEHEQIVPALSKKDIAAAIGTTPETYSRLITRLTSEGKVRVSGKSLFIL
ncbi:MAG: Crp/Fnr family transcriptional regulator [Chitinispirillaceae bacterium]|jgi:CRP/FNR family transcriptional regulator|nr:Crp/Fnr family transcriptional regulator [Chitinispirillaceae bacterium]